MSRRKRREKEKSRKKLAYGVIAVALILTLLAYFFFHQSNPTSQPKAAAIVDHLSFFSEQRNPAFISECKSILKKGGLTWAYYKGEDVTVDFYRNLPSYGTMLIILRVHSAMMRTEEGTISILGLFTSERFSIEAAKKYSEDILHERLVEAFFSPEERARNISYFGIVPKFIEESMNGNFNKTIIIMMGCEGLGYDGRTYIDMAEAFRKRGAKVCIGWDGLVSTSHTDNATSCLLQHLVQGNTVEEAVEKTMNEVGPEETYFPHQGYNSTLKYYPRAAGNYAIQHTLGISSTDTIRADTVLVKEEKKGTRLNRL